MFLSTCLKAATDEPLNLSITRFLPIGNRNNKSKKLEVVERSYPHNTEKRRIAEESRKYRPSIIRAPKLIDLAKQSSSKTEKDNFQIPESIPQRQKSNSCADSSTGYKQLSSSNEQLFNTLPKIRIVQDFFDFMNSDNSADDNEALDEGEVFASSSESVNDTTVTAKPKFLTNVDIQSDKNPKAKATNKSIGEASESSYGSLSSGRRFSKDTQVLDALELFDDALKSDISSIASANSTSATASRPSSVSKSSVGSAKKIITRAANVLRPRNPKKSKKGNFVDYPRYWYYQIMYI